MSRLRGFFARLSPAERLPVAIAVMVALVLLVVGLLAGDGDSGPGDRTATGPAEQRRSASAPADALASLVAESDPAALDPPVKGPQYARSLKDLADRLPRSRRVAQLFVVGFQGTDRRSARPFLRTLRRRNWGGVMLADENYVSAQQLADLSADVRRTAAAEEHVPLFVAAAQDGSPSQPFPDLPPGPPDEFAASPRASRLTARRAARTAGGQLRLLGVSLLLAPPLDVAPFGSPLSRASYGGEPAGVADLGAGALRGYLEADLAVAPGHFPGQGGASQDPIEGPATVGLSREELLERDVRVFRRVLPRSPAVLVSNATYSGFDGVTPATQLPEVFELLRDDLEFEGVAVADDLEGALAATGQTPGEAAVATIAAGADLVLVSDERSAERAYRAVLAAIRRGTLPEARVREALLRALQMKRSAGLIDDRARGGGRRGDGRR